MTIALLSVRVRCRSSVLRVLPLLGLLLVAILSLRLRRWWGLCLRYVLLRLRRHWGLLSLRSLLAHGADHLEPLSPSRPVCLLIRLCLSRYLLCLLRLLR